MACLIISLVLRYSRFVGFRCLTGIAIVNLRLLFLFFLLILIGLAGIRLHILILFLILISDWILLLFSFWLGRWLNWIRMCCRKIYGLLDELFHDKYVQVKLLAHALGLFFFTGKGVPSKAYFDRKPVRILGVLEARTLRKVYLDYLLDGIAHEEIVLRGVGHFQFCLIKRDFRWSTLCRRLCFALGVNLRRWVKDFVKFRLALRHDICRPLS